MNCGKRTIIFGEIGDAARPGSPPPPPIRPYICSTTCIIFLGRRVDSMEDLCNVVPECVTDVQGSLAAVRDRDAFFENLLRY